MKGTITGSSLSSVGDILAQARASEIGVIVTLGSTAECNYYLSDTVFDYAKALRDKNEDLDKLIGQVGGFANLESYANDGTLAAIRVFDEVHNATSCSGSRGISYRLTWCDSTRLLKGLPIGTDAKPGFADLLHALKKRAPHNLAVGSTSQPSYMTQVATRINLLRAREGLPALGDNSVLGYASYSRHKYGSKSAKEKFECDLVGYPGTELLFFLANRTCQYESDNYEWWSDYISGCGAERLDFYASWSWYSGRAGDFQSRIEDLADGGVDDGQGNIITLQDVQDTCNH